MDVYPHFGSLNEGAALYEQEVAAALYAQYVASEQQEPTKYIQKLANKRREKYKVRYIPSKVGVPVQKSKKRYIPKFGKAKKQQEADSASQESAAREQLNRLKLTDD